MDIKDKITTEEKQRLCDAGLEVQVLQNLLKEHTAKFQREGEQILSRLGLSPKIYRLVFNPGMDAWKAELVTGAIVIPGRNAAQAKNIN